MASAGRRHVLLTGSPGVGKTTLCRKVYEVLKDKGVHVQGFYTEEVRSSTKGSRVGFDIVTLDGRRGQLARIKGDGQTARGKSSPSVGNYLVDVKSFERLALPTISLNSDTIKGTLNMVVIVDEVGKMELFSQDFVNSVRELFSSSQATILATVPATKQRPILFVDELKRRPDVELVEVTRGTRDELVGKVVSMIEDSRMKT